MPAPAAPDSPDRCGIISLSMVMRRLKQFCLCLVGLPAFMWLHGLIKGKRLARRDPYHLVV